MVGSRKGPTIFVGLGVLGWSPMNLESFQMYKYIFFGKEWLISFKVISTK